MIEQGSICQEQNSICQNQEHLVMQIRFINIYSKLYLQLQYYKTQQVANLQQVIILFNSSCIINQYFIIPEIPLFSTITNTPLLIITLGGKMEIQEPKPANTNLPWTEKYRPKELSSLISHESILSTLSEFAKDNSFPNLIFYGPPGTGKTSTIIAYAKEIYGDNYSRNVLELNASDERGINTVREEIKTFASSAPLTMFTQQRIPKLIILDEADMMTTPAQFALRRIIQKHYKNVRFCLISNYISKIIPALISRCTRFKFNLIPLQSAKPRIQSICRAQNLNIDDSGIKAVFSLCSGDMRRIVNLLQSLSLSERTPDQGQITSQNVYAFTSHPSPNVVSRILDILLQESFSKAYEEVNNVKLQYGISLETLIKQLYNLIIELQMDNPHKIQLYTRLGEIQYRLSIGCDQRVQLASLVGIFIEIRNISKD